MKYNIEVLKNMIQHYTSNIQMFQELYQKYGSECTSIQITQMVANRRLIAAMVENGGEPLFKGMIGNMFFDTMLYSACAGSDTSKW